MGQVVEAECQACNFTRKFKFGGNMLDFEYNCPVPVLNTKTGNFQNINYLKQKDNPRYKFYSDIELKGENKGEETIQCFDLFLNVRDNYCPQCKQYKLDFYVFMLTD